MCGPVLAELQVRTQVLRFNIPHRVPPNAAETGWSAVFEEMFRIVWSNRHSALVGRYHIGCEYRDDVGDSLVASSDTERSSTWTNARQSVGIFSHAAKQPH